MVLILSHTASGLHHSSLVFTLKQLIHGALFVFLSIKRTVIGVLFLLLSDYFLKSLHPTFRALVSYVGFAAAFVGNGLRGATPANIS